MIRYAVLPGIILVSVLAGCGPFPFEYQMPALLLPAGVEPQTIAVGKFDAEAGTKPRLAELAAGALTEELRTIPHYRLAPGTQAADIAVVGEVRCRITDSEAVRPEAVGGTVQVRTADVAVTFVGTTRRGAELFTAVERPSVKDKQRFAEKFPEQARLCEELVRACVEAFVADISPRPALVRGHKPGLFSGRDRTRKGIDLLDEDRIRAVIDLTTAVRRDRTDAAAWNALGFCSEAAGDLKSARKCYLHAVNSSDREAYRHNLERVHRLITRKDAVLEQISRPED
ncbi:MAG: hypothetical protein R6V58_06230 [Planctomycetota bacterium]